MPLPSTQQVGAADGLASGADLVVGARIGVALQGHRAGGLVEIQPETSLATLPAVLGMRAVIPARRIPFEDLGA